MQTEVVPFIDATDEYEHTDPFYVTDAFRWTVPVIPGKLDWLSSIDVHVDDGEIDQFRFIDANGNVIVMLSGEMLALIDNKVPIQLTPSGVGLLANMSSASPYYIEVIARKDKPVQGHLTYHGRNQSRPIDQRGRPVAVVPPQVGTLQMWSNIHIIVDEGPNEIIVHRVGNLIRELIFTFQDRRRFCVDDVRLVYDLCTMERDEEYTLRHTDIGVYRITFEQQPRGLLPTLVPTKLALQYESPYHGTVHIGVNDVSVAFVT